jgi:hypothetical protein
MTCSGSGYVVLGDGARASRRRPALAATAGARPASTVNVRHRRYRTRAFGPKARNPTEPTLEALLEAIAARRIDPADALVAAARAVRVKHEQ